MVSGLRWTTFNLGDENNLSETMLTHAVPSSDLDERRRIPHTSRRHPVQQPGQESQNQDQVTSQAMPHRGEMKTYPAPASVTNHEGWTPWSSEDYYAHHCEVNHVPRCFAQKHIEDAPLLQLRCEPPVGNLPAYYDPGTPLLPSYHASQQISGFANDMPLRKAHSQPDALRITTDEKPPPPERNPKRLTMSKHPIPVTYQEADDTISMMQPDILDETSRTKQQGSGRKSAINIIRLRPHPLRPERSSSLAPLIPSPLSSHPASMKDTGDFPMPPVPPKNARRVSPTNNVRSSSKDRPFDVDPMDQHKTNVRRPPKGIQHWFDAYISSDDEDEGKVENQTDAGQAGLQELPAEEILRPAYTRTERASSLVNDAPARMVAPNSGHPIAPYNLIQHSPARSQSSNSIQSSHCRGRRRTLGASRRFAATDLARESVLSLSSSSSEYTSDGEDDDVPGLPAIRDSIRDSILDDRNFEVASAASVRVQRLLAPAARNSARGMHYRAQQGIDDFRSMQSYTPTPMTQARHGFLPHNPFDGSGDVDATLRRLNGSSSAKHSTNSTSPPSSDAAHVVAVTHEEMMFLEMMRRKRAEMRQESFTEGYSVALQAEQQRLAKRTISAPQAALKVLQRKRDEQSRHDQILHDQEQRNDEKLPFETQRSSSEMQRQLDDIRKAQVDAGFQIERFLGVASSNQSRSGTQTAQNPNEEPLLPATVYTPAGSQTRKATPLDAKSDVDDRMEIQRRVEEFIASQGAVPPLHSIRTMRRPSHQALSPTRSIEQAMPPIPPLRQSRAGSSSAEVDSLQHKVSVIHHSHAGMQRTSPVSAFPSHSSSGNVNPGSPWAYPHSEGNQSNVYSAMHSERPRTASAPVNRKVNPQRSLPRLRTEQSIGTQRSTLDDVLDSWHHLGGSGFMNSPGTVSQSAQT